MAAALAGALHATREFDRLERPARDNFGVTTAVALRTAPHVVLRDLHGEAVVVPDRLLRLVADTREPLGRLDRGDVQSRRLQRWQSDGRTRCGTTLSAPRSHVGLRLAVGRQADGQATPAGAVAGGEERTDAHLRPDRLDQQPRRACRAMCGVDVAEFGGQVVRTRHYRQVATPRGDRESVAVQSFHERATIDVADRDDGDQRRRRRRHRVRGVETRRVPVRERGLCRGRTVLRAPSAYQSRRGEAREHARHRVGGQIGWGVAQQRGQVASAVEQRRERFHVGARNRRDSGFADEVDGFTLHDLRPEVSFEPDALVARFGQFGSHAARTSS